MMVVPGPASQNLGSSVAGLLGIHATSVESKVFPDGESYIRFDKKLADEDVVIIQSTYPPQNKHLLELFLMLDTAREQGAKTLTAVVPYLAYARQDKVFRDGEALSARTIVRLIEASGATSFMAFDVHQPKILSLFRIPAKDISATPAIADFLKKQDLEDPFVLAPDAGASNRAKALGESLATDHGFFEKQRDRVTGRVMTVEKTIEISGRDAVIIDDMITTGSSVANVAAIIKRQGARRILAICTHPLLQEGAVDRLVRSGVETVIGTDCIESPISRISVAPLVADAVRK